MIRCTFTLQSAAPRTTPSKRCRRPANGTAAAGSGVPPSTFTRVSCCPANSHFPTRIDQWGELAGWAAGVRGRPSAWMAGTTGPPLRPLLRGSTSWGVRSVQATITSGGCCAACAANTRATWRLSEDAVRWQDAAVHGVLEAHGYPSPAECSLFRGWPWMRAPRPAAPLSPLRSLQGHKKGRGGAAARHKRRRGRDGHRCPDAAPLGGRARAWSGTSQTPCHHGHWAALRARHRGWLPRPASCKGIGGLL